MDLPHLTIAQAATLIRTRALSPVELTQALLQRIDAFDRQIHAFNTVVGEQALELARAAEREIARGKWRGPLHGIPFAAKDIYDTAGILTSGYSRAYIDRVPARDSTAVARLEAAGAILLGKLATHELANGGPSFDLPWPPARNPWNPLHFTGGSSTGAGAAVAAGFVPAALGTDTGGSIRIPAAMCGVAGLKPTYGLVSRAGVIPHSFSLDHCGPLAWTVEDCALVLQAIAGHDVLDPASVERAIPNYAAALDAGIQGLRIGVVRHFWEEELEIDPELERATEDALRVLTGLGARVESVRVPALRQQYDVKTVITKPEVFSVHRPRLIERLDDFGDDFLALTLPGCLYSASEHACAQSERRKIVAAVRAIYARYDVLLAPGSGPAPLLRASSASRVLQHWSRPNLETPFSIAPGPALTLCIGFTAAGLPLGMQIAGRPFEECTVLNVGHAYERATGWRTRRPRLSPGPPVDVPASTARLPLPEAAGEIEAYVATMTRRAGLKLDSARMLEVMKLAPLALEAARRLQAAAADGPA